MRYRTTADLEAQLAHAHRTQADLRAHITRLVVILERKTPTTAEQRWIDEATAAAFVKRAQISEIANGTAPWPRIGA